MTKISRFFKCSILLVAVLTICGCSSKADLSMDSYNKIKPDMSLQEVETIFGAKARLCDATVEQKVNARFGGGPPSPISKKPNATKYYFQSGDTWVFIDIDDTSKKVVAFARRQSS